MTQTTSRAKQVEQVQEIRNLCRLMMEQFEDTARIISDKIDALEVDLTVAYAEEASEIQLNANNTTNVTSSNISNNCASTDNKVYMLSEEGEGHAH